MDIKQLQTFIMLSQTLNYQKAAEKMQYAPSTLFKHIRLLEQEVGAPLLCKTGRQLQFTAQGQAFLPYACQIVENYHQALERVGSVGDTENALTIGGCEINMSCSLLGMFEQFSQVNPQTRMSMMTVHNAGVPALVRNETMDIGFYYSIGESAERGLCTVPLYREPVYLMAAGEHPLAGRAGLRYEDLAGVPFIYPHDTCCFVSELLRRLSGRGVSLGRITYLGGVQLVVEHVHREGAVTLAPCSALVRYTNGYGLVKLDMNEEPLLTWETVVYKSYETLKPAARALAGYSRQYAKKLVREDGAGLLLLPQ